MRVPKIDGTPQGARAVAIIQGMGEREGVELQSEGEALLADLKLEGKQPSFDFGCCRGCRSVGTSDESSTSPLDGLKLLTDHHPILVGNFGSVQQFQDDDGLVEASYVFPFHPSFCMSKHGDAGESSGRLRSNGGGVGVEVQAQVESPAEHFEGRGTDFIEDTGQRVEGESLCSREEDDDKRVEASKAEE
jgi:hypothetical protein